MNQHSSLLQEQHSGHRYRPDVDGLRAVAVLAVIAFHYGAAVPGGFVGVDVFFVISGYLITSILLVEARAGHFSLLGFYARRVKRILPAMVLVIVATLGFGALFFWPGDLESAAWSGLWSTLAAGNWYFHQNTGYFDQSADLQPLLHLWSLGVEEQFYFAWPLLFLIAYKVRGRAGVLAAAICLSVASFAWSLHEVPTAPTAAFYLPFSRAWELGIGCAVALLPPIAIPKRWAAWAAASGVLLIASSMALLTSQAPFPGLAAIAPCMGAALFIWSGAHSQSFVAKALSARAIVLVGKLSYSLYLWHWPVLVLYRHYAHGAPTTVPETAALLAGTFLLSWLSWRFVETPARKLQASQFKVVLAGGVAIALGAAGCFSVASAEGFPKRVSPEMEPLSSLWVMWNWDCPQMIPLAGQTRCAFGAPWETASHRVMLWGDSHAAHLAPLFAEAAEGTDVAIVLFDSCSALVGGRYTMEYDPEYVAGCSTLYQEAIQTLHASDVRIDHLALSSAWTSWAWRLRPSDTENDTGAGAELIVPAFRALQQDLPTEIDVTILGDTATQPVGVDALCYTPSNIPLRRPCGDAGLGLEKATFDAREGRTTAILRQLSSADVEVVDIGSRLCSTGRCKTMLGGQFVYRDRDHFRRNLEDATNRELASALGLFEIVRGWEAKGTKSGAH